MTTIDLLTPLIHQDNVKNIHFFNGRVLTAEDLQEEQFAHRKQRQQLGQAIGFGVVHGLQVYDSSTSDGSAISVKSGLALNQWGQVVQLPGDTEIDLTGSVPERSGGAGLFTNCEDSPATDLYAGPTDVYMLTISPASDYEGNVPMHSLSDNGVATGCGRRYAVEGVMFNLAGIYHRELGGKIPDQLDQLLSQDNNDIKRLSQLRNNLAHLCLGTEDAAQYAEDVFARLAGASPFGTYGMQKAAKLTKCEVPLALIHLTSNGIRFIDMWAVRRRPFPVSASMYWPLSVGSRRPSENEAAFLQFQEHLDWLVKTLEDDLADIKAADYFDYMPAAGLLQEATPGNHGVDLENFLADFDYNTEEIIIGGARLNDVLNRSFYHEPIEIKNSEGFIIYRTQENKTAIAKEEPDAPPYVLYTSPHMPLIETAHFDERWWRTSYFG